MAFLCIARETAGQSTVFRGRCVMAVALLPGPVQCQPMVSSWGGLVILLIADQRLRVGQAMSFLEIKRHFWAIKGYGSKQPMLHHAHIDGGKRLFAANANFCGR